MILKNLGIIGGTFDPVHNGHLIIAEWMRETLSLDKVFFIPNHIHPFQKRNDITADVLRLQMLQIALADYPQFEIDTIELDKKGISYSIDTIRLFKKKYPLVNLHLLIGEDNYAEFDKWKEPAEIKKLAKIVVYKRGPSGSRIPQNDEDIQFFGSPEINISSTEIRQRIKNGQSCQNLLPKGVGTFIKDNGLYV